MESSLGKLLANVTPLVKGNTIQVVQVHIQRKLVAELRRAFWNSQQLSDDVILFGGVQSLDYWVIYF